MQMVETCMVASEALYVFVVGKDTAPEVVRKSSVDKGLWVSVSLASCIPASCSWLCLRGDIAEVPSCGNVVPGKPWGPTQPQS